MKAIQEKSPGYPTQVVPSGARYTALETSQRTEVYEFRSTEPYDPRNCRISLPPITEEVFGVEESASIYDHTAISNIRGMPLTYRNIKPRKIAMEAIQEKSPGYPTQVVPSGARYAELETSNRTEVYEFRSTEPYDPRNCRISLPPITGEVFGVEESPIQEDVIAYEKIKSIQEKSPEYPTQVVPSGARYAELETSNRTEVYEFRSTEPYDPRNCRISLPTITEEVFGVEESPIQVIFICKWRQVIPKQKKRAATVIRIRKCEKVWNPSTQTILLSNAFNVTVLNYTDQLPVKIGAAN
ncbi:unnamed protein product [Mytilus edulis]|uniref:Uncharacterized protein n=1 Tax=Mytilus edulis TaxID=6550 RepID=A0A8S3SB51_MYTED|nr:unnamed protein product [Mytilus edulis]